MDIIEHVTTYKLDTLHYYGAKFWAGAKPRARDPRLYALTTIASSTVGISIGGGGGGGGRSIQAGCDSHSFAAAELIVMVFTPAFYHRTQRALPVALPLLRLLGGSSVCGL